MIAFTYLSFCFTLSVFYSVLLWFIHVFFVVICALITIVRTRLLIGLSSAEMQNIAKRNQHAHIHTERELYIEKQNRNRTNINCSSSNDFDKLRPLHLILQNSCYATDTWRYMLQLPASGLFIKAYIYILGKKHKTKIKSRSISLIYFYADRRYSRGETFKALM